MTLLADTGPGYLAPASPTSGQVERAVGVLPAVDLLALDARAALLTRIDRKYVVPMATFERLVNDLADRDDWCALEIGGLRQFGYSSVYFDTDDFWSYRAHLQGRRRRHKVRVRRYLDSDDCMLEVKLKGTRGVTVKKRRPHPMWDQERLGAGGRAWVDDRVRSHGDPPPGSAMRPVVTTTNRRTTLACLPDGARLTIDSDLTCGWDDHVARMRPGHVLLESKVGGHASAVDALLRGYGVRPVTMSKYCIGVAALGTGLPTNPWRRTLRSFFEIPEEI